MTSWRVGRSLDYTVYDGDDRLIGAMNTHAQAALVVRAVNYHDELVALARYVARRGEGGAEEADALLARIDAEEAGGG